MVCVEEEEDVSPGRKGTPPTNLGTPPTNLPYENTTEEWFHHETPQESKAYAAHLKTTIYY
jgi:hypothetical protein